MILLKKYEENDCFPILILVYFRAKVKIKLALNNRKYK